MHRVDEEETALIAQFDVRRRRGPILIVAPHPDDDILGCGGLIQVAKRSGKKIYVLFMTNGDASDQSVIEYLHERVTPKAYRQLGRLRHGEAVRAAQHLGVPASHLFFLGLPDGGSYAVATDKNRFRLHRSPYTGLSHADYSFAFHVHAPYSRHSAITMIQSVLRIINPGTVLLNLNADIHSDHRAARLLVLEASKALGIHPTVYSYLIHYPPWPNANGPLCPPKGVNIRGLTSLRLTPQEETKKRVAYHIHRSQAWLRDNGHRLIRRNELFWRSGRVR